MPPKLQRCVESWSKYCPDFELRCWTGDSLGADTPLWVTQALEQKKFAFAADYMRYHALYHFGGVYMDTDVELLRPFGSLIEAPYLMGHETHGNQVESGFVAVEPHHPFIKAMLDYYQGRSFVKADGTLDMRGLPDTLREVADANGFTFVEASSPSEISTRPNEISLLPAEYFSPISLQTLRLTVTPRTVAIHHFAATWKPRSHRIKRWIQRALGPNVTGIIIKLKDLLLQRQPQ